MAKKCLYCGVELSDNDVIDFCRRCGVNAFGKKMFEAIVGQMEDAREKGDLTHQNPAEDPNSGY